MYSYFGRMVLFALHVGLSDHMDKIRQLLSRDIQMLDAVIRQDLDSRVTLIKEISSYIIGGGGKRLRPIITILCGKITGYNSQDNLLHKMAAMIEYIHTATLLHDDVVDSSTLRRGRKTANAVFGNQASVLVGDFIYTRAFQMMVAGDSLRLLDVMASSTNRIAEGEVLQLLNIGRLDLSEEEYLEVIHAKTAVLFAAAARVATIITRSDNDTEERLAKYAYNVGTAFQIIDDVLDYFGDSSTMGKNALDDLLEKKLTLPLIYLLKHSKDNDRDLLLQAIADPNSKNTNYIITALNHSNAKDYCTNLATNLVNEACSQLEHFPASDYKDAMLRLAQLAINRAQ